MGSFEKLRPVSLLLIRLAVGAIFIAYGYEKYQRGFAAVGQSMVHLKLPAFFGYIAIVMELGGGIFLILGLLTRVIGLLMAVEMVVAIFAAHMGNGILAIHSYQFELALGAAALALGTFGAGPISLDAMLFERNSRPRMRPGK